MQLICKNIYLLDSHSQLLGTGVSLADIRKHVLEQIPELKNISRDAIHYLMAPPRKNSSRFPRYKMVVDAKVPGKRNQYREDRANQHFLFARVAYREEFVSKFKDECFFYSCDDMNKIKMGPATAVSRYHQQFRFFMIDNSPNVGDHDFPNPGYLVVCSGYQQLVEGSEDLEIDEAFTAPELNDYQDENLANFTEVVEEPAVDNNVFTYDKIGRKHHKKFVSGPSRLVLRATKFAQSTVATHANDILPMLLAQVADGKGIAFIKVDNGPDWNLLNVVNELYFCRLWRDSGLDLLGIVSYSAKFSAYNNIEHLWSPMSRKLASVILPSVLEGDDEPPCKQSHLSESERKEKEAMVS